MGSLSKLMGNLVGHTSDQIASTQKTSDWAGKVLGDLRTRKIWKEFNAMPDKSPESIQAFVNHYGLSGEEQAGMIEAELKAKDFNTAYQDHILKQKMRPDAEELAMTALGNRLLREKGETPLIPKEQTARGLGYDSTQLKIDSDLALQNAQKRNLEANANQTIEMTKNPDRFKPPKPPGKMSDEGMMALTGLVAEINGHSYTPDGGFTTKDGKPLSPGQAQGLQESIVSTMAKVNNLASARGITQEDAFTIVANEIRAAQEAERAQKAIDAGNKPKEPGVLGAVFGDASKKAVGVVNPQTALLESAAKISNFADKTPEQRTDDVKSIAGKALDIFKYGLLKR